MSLIMLCVFTLLIVSEEAPSSDAAQKITLISQSVR